ncbi:MAG: hypothetical protein COB03_16760 [Alteromonas sp.]|nr:MAG: hypothetical protein COB03_16760 [Alteromonas sp.]
MDLLNSREWALVIWFSIAILCITFLPKAVDIKKSMIEVVKAFFAKSLMVIYGLLLFYLFGIVYFLNDLGLWESHQLKNTIVWLTTVGVFSLFQINKIKEDRNFFKRAILDNLKLIAVIQFFVGIYTFHIVAELILLPFLSFITILVAFFERDKAHARVHSLLNGILSFFGLLLVAYFIYALFTNFGEVAKEKTPYDFFTPVILTVFYTPFLFFMLVYSVYEVTFVRIKYFIKSKWMRGFFKVLAVIVFNYRIELLERWASSLVHVNTESFSSIIYSMYEVFKLRKAEKATYNVPKSEGWCPYTAKDFLKGEDLNTGYYHRSFEEWFASSEMVEFGDGVIPCNITYYVKGIEKKAEKLKISINVNDESMIDIALEKLVKTSTTLFEKALGENIPDDILHDIGKGDEISIQYKGKQLSLIKSYWPEHRLGGFDIKFELSNT